MNTTSESNPNLGNQTLGGFGYGIGLSIACLVMFAIVTYISYVCKRVHGVGGPTNHHHLHRRSLAAMNAPAAPSPDSSTVSNQCNGLDEATLSTYPQFAYSEIGAHKINESYASACSVCLADYKGADLVRLLSGCGHLFHVKCIDPWLMVHPTCPVCRSSPLVINLTPGT